MSTQRGNAARTRRQKYQNTSSFKNDKYGANAKVKAANAKVHEGVCEHCKEVLEWKVKYNKYKPLSQPRRCVKCQQKSVKDAYYILCKPCALELKLCAKCGKQENIVIPLEGTQEEAGGLQDVTLKATGQSNRTNHTCDDEQEEDANGSDEESDFESNSDDLVETPRK